MNILDHVSATLAELSKSERKVAEVILREPEATIHRSIAVMAKLADVSEPTVNRFCRRLGSKGFPDFKLQLAQALVAGTPYLNRHVQQNDTVAEYTDKIFESTQAALELARNKVNLEVVEAAVAKIVSAHKILFLGLGASASVAHDAHNKFLRFDVPVLFSDDILTQKMMVMNCTRADLIICVSHTGRTKAICEIAALARETGATVLGLTADQSPLAQHCDLVLATHVPEDTDVYMPMVSRIAQLVLIDALITGFTLQRGPAFQAKLRDIKESLVGSRFDAKQQNSN